MAMNRIQFQKGLSLADFMRSFGSEEQCLAAVVAARWPQGFRCPRCAAPEHYVVGGRARPLYQCTACRHQASPIAGTLFEQTKLPLTVETFSRAAIADWARMNLGTGANVYSDGLGCFAAVTDAGCWHFPTTAAGRLPRELPAFRWVNTVLGNLKTMLAGSLHAFKFRKYADSYFAAFAYRFNRRFDLRDLFARLVVDASPPRQNTCRLHRTRLFLTSGS